MIATALLPCVFNKPAATRCTWHDFSTTGASEGALAETHRASRAVECHSGSTRACERTERSQEAPPMDQSVSQTGPLVTAGDLASNVIRPQRKVMSASRAADLSGILMGSFIVDDPDSVPLH